MAELQAEKIQEIRQAIARLRGAAHELDALLAEVEPMTATTTTAMIDPALNDFMQKVLPEDEKQRLTEILPQLADGSGRARSGKPRKAKPRRPQ
jgi:hypothetical protein